MNLKEQANVLKRDIPAVYLSLKDKETPLFAKICAAITVAYALSPIDLIPDFIPILGYLDDVILLPLMIYITIKFIPKEIWNQKRKEVENLWKDGKPKKWVYAIPILLFYVLLIMIIIKGFLSHK